MIGLSHTTGYAIRALACLLKSQAKPAHVKDIACCAQIPPPYLAKIFNQLAHKGIIVSKRGYRGGVTLAKAPGEISLLEIVHAIEGEHWLEPCLFGIVECQALQSCPTHQFWLNIRTQIEAELAQRTLADVINITGKLTACSCADLTRAQVRPTEDSALNE